MHKPILTTNDIPALTMAAAQTLASDWHGGQPSALYSFASTGKVLPELALYYLFEVQQELQPEYHSVHSVERTESEESSLLQLRKFFTAELEKMGVKTQWEQEPTYYYWVPVLADEPNANVYSLNLPA